ncbi:50S ribosomal protein L22 [bacterium]
MEEAVSKVKYAKITWRKVGQVLPLIRNKRVDVALRNIQFINKAAVPLVRKALQSAVANFGKKANPDQLIVNEVYVGQAPSMKRLRPGSMGRASMYKKRMSHITIKVKRVTS